MSSQKVGSFEKIEIFCSLLENAQAYMFFQLRMITLRSAKLQQVVASHAHTHTHTRTHTHTHTHTRLLTHYHSSTRTSLCIGEKTYGILTHSSIQTHILIHTQTHTLTHTDTHIYSLKTCSLSPLEGGQKQPSCIFFTKQNIKETFCRLPNHCIDLSSVFFLRKMTKCHFLK